MNPQPRADSYPTSPTATLLQWLRGPWIAQSIYVAAKLGLADLMKQGPVSVDVLAQTTGTNAHALYRLLRLLASVEIFTEVANKVFGVTPLAQLLQSDTSGSLRDLAAIYGEAMFWQPWGNLLHTIQTGETAFDATFEKSIYAYLAVTPEMATYFDQAMSGLVTQVAEAIATDYDFTPFHHLVDIGSGKGTLIRAILHKHLHLTATLMDLDPVIAHAHPQMKAAGLADRSQLVAGDFFQAVPEGGDLYILSTVICNWDDEHALAILRNCRRAMAPQSTLLLVEIVLPAGDAPSPGKLLDLQMMVMTGGRDRTEAEYHALLNAAGFTLQRVLTTFSERNIIEAIPRI